MSAISSSSRGRKQLSKIQQLELENAQMEERLRSFRENMAREKAKRSFAAAANGGSIWVAGEMTKSSLSKYAVDILANKKSKGYSGIGREVEKSISTTSRSNLLQKQAQSTSSSANNIRNDSASNQADTAFIPIPPSAEKPPMAASPAKRVWRVPASMKIHATNNINEKDTVQQSTIERPASIQNNSSLLQGEEFDAEASHKSFLDALREWRGETTKKEPENEQPKVQFNHHIPQAIATSSYEIDAGQQTVQQDKPVNFEVPDSSLSYFDRLRLSKARNSGTATPLTLTLPLSDEPPSLSEEEVLEWDEEDEDFYLEIIRRRRQSKIIGEQE